MRHESSLPYQQQHCKPDAPPGRHHAPHKELAPCGLHSRHNILLSDNLDTHVPVVGNTSGKALPTTMLYLTASRADSIVADAELVRETLLISSDAQNSRWSLLGQSFGGFCAVQYLSAAPQGKQFLLSG